ncbi:hypothetical protein [Winogradskyella endarachnes]|uniref:Uncharacterized protein n=1 Tax=Winogradskyella endarachnes TaxID=2681965 RepID=A0A6L6U965_9FLAO|nr:hypothetical protein [Winogradskyella endarachnes]MUU78880.1 hypothetical protein [Winogradskyella endarachnes]
MFKTICTLLITFSTLNGFSQKITLVKNTHPQAKELKHNLNKTKDSLILECDKKIIEVDFFNEDFEKTVLVNDLKTKISLEDMPQGKFIIEAKLTNKIILIDLIKHEDFSKDIAYNNEPAEGQGMMLDETLNVIKVAPKISISYILTREKKSHQNTKPNKFYWVILQVNNQNGSSKTMKLVDQNSVDRMIAKHKSELNSDSGKFNELTIWEVYNTADFMENQVSNPDYVYTSTTKSFNTTPYYSTATSNSL